MTEQNTPLPTEEGICSEDVLMTPPPVVVLPDNSEDMEPTLLDNEPLVSCISKKKISVFLICLMSYFVLLLALIGTALWFFNKDLIRYEAATPNGALDQYVQWIREGNYEAMYSTSGFEGDTFNNRNSYLQYVKTLYADPPQDIVLRERVSTDDNVRLFSVYFGDRRVSILLLSSEETDGDKPLWRVTTQLTYQPTYTVIAGSDVRVSLNGEDITLLNLPSEEIQNTLFTGANSDKIYPAVQKYTFEGLLNKPVFEAIDLFGSPCESVADPEDPYTIRFKQVPDEEERLAQDDIATNVATTYAMFIARDANRNDILALVYKDTALYSALKNFSNYWFTPHDSYEFKDLKVFNYYQYTASDFTCEVTFQPVYYRKNKTFNWEPAHYRITFIKMEDTWKVISLVPVTSTDSDSSTDDVGDAAET